MTGAWSFSAVPRTSLCWPGRNEFIDHDGESGNVLQLQFVLTYVRSRYDEKMNE